MRTIFKLIDMPCDECRELNSHQFRSPEDLIDALRVATMEMDRGVLQQVQERGATISEQEALQSAFAAGALPGDIRYRFSCVVCGDRFELFADTKDGSGAWIRNDETSAPPG